MKSKQIFIHIHQQTHQQHSSMFTDGLTRIHGLKDVRRIFFRCQATTLCEKSSLTSFHLCLSVIGFQKHYYVCNSKITTLLCYFIV